MGKLLPFSRITGLCLLFFLLFIHFIPEIDGNFLAVSGDVTLFFENLANTPGCLIFYIKNVQDSIFKYFILFLFFFWFFKNITIPL
ncbi:MAG: hypothetical protein JXB88_17105, partial [Spirochaetales bacterium]|nr:hypothetical protein [Spirochaetales bacterium]